MSKPRPLPIARSPLPKRTKSIRKRSRSKSEFARIYGSKARVEFVKSLPCAACGVVGYSENAHLLGNGGMSRKADADTIGPLCGYREVCVAEFKWEVRFGCHGTYDKMRWAFNARFPDFDPEKVARETEELWASSVLEDTR